MKVFFSFSVLLLPLGDQCSYCCRYKHSHTHTHYIQIRLCIAHRLRLFRHAKNIRRLQRINVELHRDISVSIILWKPPEFVIISFFFAPRLRRAHRHNPIFISLFDSTIDDPYCGWSCSIPLAYTMRRIHLLHNT